MNVLDVLARKNRDHHWPMHAVASKSPPGTGISPLQLRATMTTALLIKATENCYIPFTIFVYHRVEAFLNCHHTQHFFVSHLMSYMKFFVNCSSHESSML